MSLNRIGKFLFLLALVMFMLSPIGPGVNAAPLSGQIIVDPGHPQWLRINGGGLYFMCGPGDPEDFLYRGTRNNDGTRSGDQMTIINKLKGTGANCLYVQAVRSHGGDGNSTHNPFIDSNPASGVDLDILNQWETWFTEMDNNGITIFFIFYDDGAKIWDTGDTMGSAEKTFFDAVVNKFEQHKNLIWCMAEESVEVYGNKRISNLAAEIRAADDYDHVIANHQNHGLVCYHPDDPNLEQFAIQYNATSVDELHSGMVTAWNNAAGRYNLNMAECAFHSGKTGAALREINWATAMGGAYVMIIGMNGLDTPVSDLQGCGRLAGFFQVTDFNNMAPHDELKNGGTRYVLASPGNSYIAYATSLSGNIGLKSMTAGTYEFKWYDIPSGTFYNESKSVSAGDNTWTKPAGIGNELAVYLKRTGFTATPTPAATPTNRPPVANNQAVSTIKDTPVSFILSYSAPDSGPGPYTVTILTQPGHGALSGQNNDRTYTPNTGYTGSDSFTWKVHDGVADSNTATVSITVNPAGIITNLVVNDSANSADWSIRANIQSGNQQYGDRTFTFAAVPASVAGSDWIRAANDSKAYTGDPLVTFKVTQNADVYVAHNDLITTKPSWMTGWTDSGENITNNEATPKTFSLFKKYYTANSTVSLGMNGSTSEGMYTIIAKVAGATATPTPTSATTATPTPTPSPTPTPTPAGANPVGWWKFDETSGTTAADSSGNGLNGTLTNVPVWTAGKLNNCLSFDATDDYVNIGNPTQLQITGAMTVAGWVYVDTFTTNGRVIAKQGGSSNRCWSLSVESADSKAQFAIATNSTTLVSVKSAAVIPTGQWVHLTGVYEPGTALRMYVNKTLSNSNTTSIPASQYNNSLNVNLGRRPDALCYWDGKLDDVRVYNVALTAEQIAALP